MPALKSILEMGLLGEFNDVIIWIIVLGVDLMNNTSYLHAGLFEKGKIGKMPALKSGFC